MNVTAAFARYRLTEAQSALFRGSFTLLIEATPLIGCERIRPALSSYRGISGLYFWTICEGSDEYKIYVGRSGNLAQRVENYLSTFQAQSPNDFKLQIFARFLREHAPLAQFNYYVNAIPRSELKAAETRMVREHGPFLNHLARPSESARAALVNAFDGYYRSRFEQTLEI